MLSSFNATHEALRMHTKHAHNELDSTPCFRQLLSNRLGVEEYALCISSLAAWYDYHESVLYHKLAIQKDLTFLQKKSPLIELDLQALEEPMFLGSEPEWQQSKDNFADKAYCLGFLYVIEGSTLGGLVIAPKVEKTLERTDITHFYRCYGAHKINNFSQTMQYIHDYCASNNSLITALDGASEAFTQLRHWVLANYSNKQVA